MTDETPSRITVSRDALRADLAEMELRLRVYFDDQLKQKADRADLAAVALRVAELERAAYARDRGDFTPAQARAMTDLIQDTADDKQSRTWTSAQKVMALVSISITVTAFILSLTAFFGGS